MRRRLIRLWLWRWARRLRRRQTAKERGRTLRRIQGLLERVEPRHGDLYFIKITYLHAGGYAGPNTTKNGLCTAPCVGAGKTTKLETSFTNT